MNISEVIRFVEGYKKGTYTKFRYKTELPLKAEYRKMGFSITKITSTVARTCVNYGHLSSTIERKERQESDVKVTRKNNYTEVIPNCIYFNTNTNKNYLQIATIPKNSVFKSYYVVEKGSDINVLKNLSESEKGMLTNSYVKHKIGDMPSILRINLDNVLSIGKNG